METIRFNNKNNERQQWRKSASYGASAKKSKLSKLKITGISLINNENNLEATMRTINILWRKAPRNLNYLNQRKQ